MVCEDSVCGIDTETERIKNKYTTPPLVLFGACSGHKVQMCDWQYFEQYQAEFLRVNPKTKFAFFNGPFDQRVMGADTWIPELNKDDRVMELQAAYPCYKMATTGKFVPYFTLELLTREFFGWRLDKDESVRLEFKRTEKPTEQQYVYMAYDAISTYKLGELLQGQPTESIQARAAFVLSEIGMNGMREDQEYVLHQQEILRQTMVEEGKKLLAFGYPLKREWDSFKAVDFVTKVCNNIGLDNIDVILGDRKTIPQWWWKALALNLYGRVLNKAPISEIRAVIRDLLTGLMEPPPDNKAFKEFKAETDEKLLELMEDLECTECLIGLGNGKKPSCSTPWQVLSLITSEKIANGTPQHNYLRDQVHEELKEEFKELHEQNRGWLKENKPLSAGKFIQVYIRKLLSQYPELDLPLTKTSQINVNNALYEEAKAAKAEKRPQRELDLDNIKVYQVTGKEAWRFEDCGIDDPFLKSYWKYKHAEKMLSTYMTLKYMDSDGRDHPRFTSFLKTGRTGCSSPLKNSVRAS